MFKRIILIVMDSVGIGHGTDAAQFHDGGANTIGHIEEEGPIDCDFLKSLGLSEIADLPPYEGDLIGVYGRLMETSAGKDTTSGHWEFMGHPLTEAFPTFPQGFPKELMDIFVRETGHEYLGNEVASGTEIIQRLGDEHVRTKRPIIYTSADSVFQIAAHEEVIPLEELYRICDVTRNKVCIGPYNVGRIIARPFVGHSGHYVRTPNRHDYSRMPSHSFYHERIKEAGYDVIGVGKMGDIYAHIGFTESYPTISNEHGMLMMANLLGSTFKKGVMLVNLVEFDSKYGHRRNVQGYREAIERFDKELRGFVELLNEDDLILITADHGNDPTWTGTDHTRERVPLLGYSKGLKKSISIGDRYSFADVGQTVLENFSLPLGSIGDSFYQIILEGCKK